MAQPDTFTWNPNPDADSKTAFTMTFTLPRGSGSYHGRATADASQRSVLAARWLGLMAALRKNSRFVTEQLAREAWFACIGIPNAQQRFMVERARTIIATHIGSDTLAQIYRETA